MRRDQDNVVAMNRPEPPAIRAQQLSKTYPGGVEAVKEIDFEVAPGETFGLLGPNGAGKSTAVGMLTTTIGPTGGTAQLAGFDGEIVELRVEGDGTAALALLRARRIAGEDAFNVGSTLTIPLHDRSAA